MERDNTLRHLHQGELKLGSKLIQIGSEDSDNYFIFKLVKFEQLLDTISSDKLPKVYRFDIRFNSYCTTIHQRQLEMKEAPHMQNNRTQRHDNQDTLATPIFVKNCLRLNQKNNRKRCFRQQRKLCRRKIAEGHLDWTIQDMVQTCKHKNLLQNMLKQCIWKKMTSHAHLSKKSAKKMCKRRRVLP